MVDAPDVLVIGAGVAGLACAAALTAAGRRTVVLEARDRAGGRIHTLPGSPPVEAGAQAVHGERAVTWSVLRAAGLRAEPLPVDVPFVVVADGRRHEPPDLMRAGLGLPWVIESHLVAGAEERAVAEQLRDDAGGRVMIAWLAQKWCADPARLTSAGMARSRAAWTAGDADFELPDGYAALVDHLAQGLDVRHGQPVARLEWEAGGVRAGAWSAAHAVVTVPAPVVAAGGLRFDPPLPAEKAAACAAIATGDALTVVVRFSGPSPRAGWALVADAPAGFWRARTGSPSLLGSFKGPAAAAARAVLDTPERLLRGRAHRLPVALGPGAHRLRRRRLGRRPVGARRLRLPHHGRRGGTPDVGATARPARVRRRRHVRSPSRNGARRDRERPPHSGRDPRRVSAQA